MAKVLKNGQRVSSFLKCFGVIFGLNLSSANRLRLKVRPTSDNIHSKTMNYSLSRWLHKDNCHHPSCSITDHD